MKKHRSIPLARTRRQFFSGAAVLLPAFALTAEANGEAKVPTIAWPELKLLNGATLRPSDWSNMPAVVVFWETWCPYCKRLNAHINQLYLSTLGQKIRIIGVTTEKNEEKVNAYLKANQFSFPVAMVDANFRAQFTTRQIVPITCLVAGSGRLIQVIPGEMTMEDVMGLPTALLMSSTSKIRYPSEIYA